MLADLSFSSFSVQAEDSVVERLIARDSPDLEPFVSKISKLWQSEQFQASPSVSVSQPQASGSKKSRRKRKKKKSAKPQDDASMSNSAESSQSSGHRQGSSVETTSSSKCDTSPTAKVDPPSAVTPALASESASETKQNDSGVVPSQSSAFREFQKNATKKSIRKRLRRYLKLVYANSFGLKLPLLDDQAYALAVFPRVSMFNHSCAPNCHYYFEGT